jgi:putative tricarboxylic transport membrane protein
VNARRTLAILLVAALLVPALIVRGGAASGSAPSIRTGLARAQAQCPTGEYPTKNLQIMAPASPGGGWDTTAREMATALGQGVTSQKVDVFNVPGAGGTVGLAELVNEHKGDDHFLMMMGLVMVGAIATNASPVSLESTTPIARLIAEYEVVVVPANSPYQTLADLVAAFQADPGSIAWGGGSAGGTDHILVGLIAQAVGVDPTQINYIPFSGGGEALAAVLGGQVAAGVSGLGEWQQQIEAGELRALALSTGAVGGAATPTTGAAIPSLQSQGVDVALANWRGIVAPPDISDEARQCMIAMVDQMHGGEAWSQVLAQNGWQDFYQTGDEFGAYLEQERERVDGVLRDLGLIE